MGTNKITDPFFRKEFEVCCRPTWMSALPNNISVIYYQGGDRTELVGDVLTVACEDDLVHTYKKTYLAIEWVYKNLDFDFIFRTNTSTYINGKLLDLFVNKCYVEGKYYGSDIYSLSEGFAPYPLIPYIRGNGILMSFNTVKEFLLEGISLLYLGITDDIGIGNVMNSYEIKGSLKSGIQYKDNHAGIPHTWYKSIDNVFNTGHQLGNFNSSEKYWMSPTTTIKKYRERNMEFDYYKEFHQKVLKLQYPSDEEIVSAMKDYSENFDIFIGSILGYIPYEQWKQLDKNKLYLMEISNKASDDEQFWIRRDIQGRFLDFDMSKL